MRLPLHSAYTACALAAGMAVFHVVHTVIMVVLPAQAVTAVWDDSSAVQRAAASLRGGGCTRLAVGWVLSGEIQDTGR